MPICGERSDFGNGSDEFAGPRENPFKRWSDPTDANMRLKFIQNGLLVCPQCVKGQKTDNDFSLYLHDDFLAKADPVRSDQDVTTGTLICRTCKRSYPILDGVGIFTINQGIRKYEDPALAQGYVQTHFRDLICESEDAKPYLAEYDETAFYSTEPKPTYYSNLVELLGNRLQSGATALDLGCSVGRLTHELAVRSDFAIGVDLSFVSVALAREILLTRKARVNLGQPRVSGSGAVGREVEINLERVVQPNVEFIVADEQTLPFRNGIFDVICAASVIDRVPDVDAFLTRLGRVSREGTTLLLTSPFDYDERYTPKEKWLGFKSFRTSEGKSETALKEVLKKHRYNLIAEQSIRWATFSDRRHHSVWSVYSGVFEAWSCEFLRLRPTQELSASLIEAYQRVFGESKVYKESVSPQAARDAFKKLDLLVIAVRGNESGVIGFAGGRELTAANAKEYGNAYERLRDSVGHPIFKIDDLGVLEEYEGASVGTQLLEGLLGLARSEGFHTFVLVTNSDNEKALSLYSKKGFSSLFDRNGLVSVQDHPKRRFLYRVDDFSRVTLSDNSEVCLEFIWPATMTESGLILIAEVISKLFVSAFWHSEVTAKHWPVEDIMLRLPTLALIVLTFEASSRKPIGYMMFDRASWNGCSILFVDSGAVIGDSKEDSRNWQNSGVGSRMFREGLRRIPSDIVIARTQNPAAVRLLRSKALNFSRIIPLDADYSPADSELIRSVKNQIIELRDADIDLKTGICKEAYKEGELGHQVGDMDDEELDVAFFKNRMKQLDPSWDSKQGDAVILIARINGAC